ncbi:MAG: hypothetical protein WC640_03060 [Candidatus Paceibacterota bacterium]|jgi:hypothetical protein
MKIKSLTIVISLLLAFVLSAASVSAQTATSGPEAKVATAAVTRLIERGDKALANRIDALNQLNARIQEMKLVTEANKASISAQIQTQITGLNALKQKINADTDPVVLKEDVKSITGGFRIFALVIPQGRIIAVADRLNTIAGDLTAVMAKLQTRLNVAQAAGKDITSITVLMTDLNAKITDARTQAEAAVARSVNLTPDNGDKTIMASNKEALTKSRDDIKVGHQDLVTARQDVTKILKALKAFKLPTASSTPAN